MIFKIGIESLYGYPERIFSYCEARDVRFFVNAKLHDIPRTVGAAMTQLVRPGAHIVNVHALGGVEMMRAAVEAAQERALELGITVPLVLRGDDFHQPQRQKSRPSSGCTASRGRVRRRACRRWRAMPAARVWCAVRTRWPELKHFFGQEFVRAHAEDATGGRSARRSKARHDAGAGGCRRRRLLLRRRNTQSSTAPDPLAAARAVLDENLALLA